MTPPYVPGGLCGPSRQPCESTSKPPSHPEEHPSFLSGYGGEYYGKAAAASASASKEAVAYALKTAAGAIRSPTWEGLVPARRLTATTPPPTHYTEKSIFHLILRCKEPCSPIGRFRLLNRVVYQLLANLSIFLPIFGNINVGYIIIWLDNNKNMWYDLDIKIVYL